MSSLLKNLVPFNVSRHRDVTTDPEVSAVFAYHIDRLFDPSENVECCGYMDDSTRLRIVLLNDKSVWRTAEVECTYGGFMEVKAKPGFFIKQEIGLDLGTDVEKAWLKASGFPIGHPCSTEIEVSMEGLLTISVVPCR